ncbi:MAG: MFS transporter [Synechococcaceae cyanobacterium RL_1_2]|nr:MFS transporter [Synechococcaceae cyanobacterium RL_1_2]
MQLLSSFSTPQRRMFTLLFISGLGYWLSLTALLPVISPYVQDLGRSDREVGLVMGFFSVGALISRLYLGPVLDQKGRKLGLMIGAIAVTITPLGYIVFTSTVGLMMVRMFHGLSLAAFTLGYSSLVVDLCPPDRKGEILGNMNLVIPIGMTLGPAIGGFLENLVSYRTMFLVATGIGLLSFLTALPLPETDELSKTEEQRATPINPRNLIQLFKDPGILIPTFLMAGVGVAFGAITSFMPLFIRAEEIPLNAGVFYSVAAIGNFIARFTTGKASDRYGRGFFTTISMVLYTIAMVGISQSQTAQGLMICALIQGMASGLFIPMILVLLSDRCYPQERAQAYSISFGGYDTGVSMAGPIIGGFGLGYRDMYTITGVITFLTLLLFLSQGNTTVKNSLRFAFGKGKDHYAIARS